MAFYTAREVKRILKLENHTIRYWVKEIPLIQPKRDKQGRRLYAERDLQILLRLKYLLYDRRFTIEGAKEQLFRELAGDQQDLRAQISALRSELVELYLLVNKNENNQADTKVDQNRKPSDDIIPTPQR
ncbi:MAG: MerR family transcriptional regulator [Treponema sp.]|nr:MerR family transcriptional regulator [Treponema sp.]